MNNSGRAYKDNALSIAHLAGIDWGNLVLLLYQQRARSIHRVASADWSRLLGPLRKRRAQSISRAAGHLSKQFRDMGLSSVDIFTRMAERGRFRLSEDDLTDMIREALDPRLIQDSKIVAEALFAETGLDAVVQWIKKQSTLKACCHREVSVSSRLGASRIDLEMVLVGACERWLVWCEFKKEGGSETQSGGVAQTHRQWECLRQRGHELGISPQRSSALFLSPGGDRAASEHFHSVSRMAFLQGLARGLLAQAMENRPLCHVRDRRIALLTFIHLFIAQRITS